MKMVISSVFLLLLAAFSVDCRWYPGAQKKSWLENRECANLDSPNGKFIARAPNGKLAECNPDGNSPCCSDWGHCGLTDDHCKCKTCIDYRVPVCPDGGVVVGGQCLVFHNEKQNWAEAFMRCVTKGGKLAPLADPKAFHEYAKDHFKNEVFWLGGKDFDHEGSWQWVADGTWFGQDFPWPTGEPNNQDGRQHCLTWGSLRENWNGQYDDRNCNEKYKYVCVYN